eukprot:gnl/Carplike_NY0171/1925_a2604_920.p1 GENE.gnl/Carplike_NY0171/1925_a2604_920~~gnl/Carplike_NY0171/1925_a2604_920.p1  ORF type:complete len:396 (-),score=97.00 gnl/Carplike_NY0171/1925_a2604_920:137-1324(-)
MGKISVSKFINLLLEETVSIVEKVEGSEKSDDLRRSVLAEKKPTAAFEILLEKLELFFMQKFDFLQIEFVFEKLLIAFTHIQYLDDFTNTIFSTKYLSIAQKTKYMYHFLFALTNEDKGTVVVGRIIPNFVKLLKSGLEEGELIFFSNVLQCVHSNNRVMEHVDDETKKFLRNCVVTAVMSLPLERIPFEPIEYLISEKEFSAAVLLLLGETSSKRSPTQIVGILNKIWKMPGGKDACSKGLQSIVEMLLTPPDSFSEACKKFSDMFEMAKDAQKSAAGKVVKCSTYTYVACPIFASGFIIPLCIGIVDILSHVRVMPENSVKLAELEKETGVNIDQIMDFIFNTTIIFGDFVGVDVQEESLFVSKSDYRTMTEKHWSLVEKVLKEEQKKWSDSQ